MQEPTEVLATAIAWLEAGRKVALATVVERCRGNHAKRLKRLAALGYSKAQLSRVHGPIGLSLGGRSPAEIAVAILAQVIQSRHQPTSR